MTVSGFERRKSAVMRPGMGLLALPLVWGAGCCVNPFINTDTERLPEGAGTPAAEVGESLAEAEPALHNDGEGSAEAGFDLRLVRVQPGVHLDTEVLCDVVAALRLEAIERGAGSAMEPAEDSLYDPGATQRMSIRCVAPTGESWADVEFTATDAAHATEVQPGTRVALRIRTAEGGFFDYPIVDFVRTIGPSPESVSSLGSAATATIPNAFDLRAVESDPSLIGTTQECAIGHAGEIDIVEPSESRRRPYPAGVQNRMTVRCHHASGEEWADLVFMPSQSLSALHVGRGDVVRVLLISRNGGAFDYPVVQFVGS